VQEFQDEIVVNGISRELLALEILEEILTRGVSEREAVKKIMKKHKITDWKIRGAVHALVFETIRRLNVLDKYIFNSLRTKSSFKKLDSFLKNLLRLGVYEIKFVEKSAALVTNELNNVAHDIFGSSNKKAKFINALLRKVEKTSDQEIFGDLSLFERLSLKYQYPTWYIKYLTYLFNNQEEIIAFLKKGNEIPITSIRVNTLKINKDDLIQLLTEEQYIVREDQQVPDLLIIEKSSKPITWSKFHRQGYFYIQSKSSMSVPYVLDPRPHEIVLDLCAAPGGKTTHMAQMMQNSGRIFAFERSLRRVKELHSNVKKMGATNVEIVRFDSRYITNTLQLKADKVLVDAPCTGTGTIHSRPTIKWKFKPRDFYLFSSIQFTLLSEAARLIKTGGIIVYSTCSILYEENEQIIGRFLKLHPNFRLVSFDVPHGTPGLYPLSRTRRIYPHVSNSEGFFIAKIKLDETKNRRKDDGNS